MQVNHKIIKTTTLIMNEDEVEWLKGLIQNPFNCDKCNPDYDPVIDEPKKDREMRRRFWDALYAQQFDKTTIDNL